MIHYKATQRIDGKWDYTIVSKHNSGVMPAGYCMPYDFVDPYKTDKYPFPMSEQQKQNIRTNRNKYHDTGHITKEEACECYKDYLLDNMTRYYPDQEPLSLDKVMIYLCAICKNTTYGFATVGSFHNFGLCNKHNNRESLEKLLTVGESWQS